MKILNRIKEAARVFVGSEKGNVDAPHFESLGDGNAELLTDMTEEEYQNYLRDEEQGWGKWRKKMGL